MTESQESFLGGSSASHPSQDNFRGGSDAGGGIDSAAFLQQECGDSEVLIEDWKFSCDSANINGLDDDSNYDNNDNNDDDNIIEGDD